MAESDVHICVICRHRRVGCVRRVEGPEDSGRRWVCAECLEEAGQMRLEDMPHGRDRDRR
ncbi:MAG TPA: hypothetical protein VG476_04500 [Acidimicrobiales bacterium]|nr:hypothetical protein [Acidimicrobiales bacterium]